MKTRCALLAILLILMSAANGYAHGWQNSTPAQSARVKVSDEQLERMLMEIEHLRTVQKLSDDEKAALREQLQGYQDLLGIERERIAALKTAVAERTTANTLDEKRVALFEASLKDFQKQVDRLTKERDRARGLLKYVGVAALAVGGALGYLLGSR